MTSMTDEYIGKRTIPAIQRLLHEWAQEKGWIDDRTFGDDIALMHSELSEALEEHRDGRGPGEVYYRYKSGSYDFTTSGPTCVVSDGGQMVSVLGKPEGIPIELADVIIRILQWAARNGVDMEKAIFEKMAYNDGRPYRHGGRAL